MADRVLPSASGIYITNTLSILWYICWPVGVLLYYLAIAVLTMIKLLYQPVGFLLQPLVYVGRFLLACLIAPFRLLVKFEVSRLQSSLSTTTDHISRHFTSISASPL